MKALAEIELQLSRVGIHNRLWQRAEVIELKDVLSHDEQITNAVNGRYDGGFCLLVATDRRLLLIDKKIWYLSMEDVRFDMIAELDYCARLMDATLSVRTLNKILRFTSFSKKQLRSLTSYLQERVMELRHQSIQTSDQPIAVQPVVQYVQTPVQQTPIGQATQPLPAPLPPLEQSLPVQPIQQIYATQIKARRPSRLRRIGAYPTSSLTMERRFSK